MATTTFSGPVVSTNGFTGDLTGAVVGTTLSSSSTLTVGSAGTAIKQIKYGTVAIDPASLAANSSAETAVTITGAAAGDIVLFNVPASLEAGLAYSGCRVSAADTAQVRLSNVTSGAVDGASRTWSYIWIDLT